MEIKKLYKFGKLKALTLSYDDGTVHDIRLSKILDKYGIKCTFNLNSSHVKNRNESGEFPLEVAKECFKNHEVAMHMVNHPHPTQIDDQQLEFEIAEDKRALSEYFDRDVRGMAYPFGDYNDHIIAMLEKYGVAYSRTTKNVFDFSLPENFLEWHSTCHHNNPELQPLVNKFLNSDRELALFYLWGHSYEFERNNNWNVIEEFCESICSKEDVWYATNIEIYDYIQAMNQLIITENGEIINPTDTKLFVSVDGTLKEV